MKIKFIFLLLATASLFTSVSCSSDPAENANDSTDVKAEPALAKLNADIKEDPSNAEYYHARAKYYYEKKKIIEGLADMGKAISIDSSKSAYFLTLSDLCFVSNKTSDAKKALETAVRIDPKNTDAIMKLAELHLYVRQHDKSIEYINMALRVDAYIAKAYFIKGMNYKEMKDTVRAISSMQTAVEQDQQYYQAFMQLGLLCASIKDPLAAQYYKNAIRIQPKSYEAWYGMGKYYQDVKDWTNALGTYNSILQIEPASRNVHYNMAVVYMFGLKKNELALEHFNLVIQSDPDFAEGYYARGICYQAMGKKKEAINDLEACMKIDPNNELAKAALKDLGR